MTFVQLLTSLCSPAEESGSAAHTHTSRSHASGIGHAFLWTGACEAHSRHGSLARIGIRGRHTASRRLQRARLQIC